ncbi:MAG: TonB-dependent receptor [Sphingomonadaceae bacterium]
MKKLELLGATALALLISTPSFAQTATPAEEKVDAGDIIVTATLRNENLQDVPIAVTAFNTETLEKAGVRDIRALDNVSASFNLNSTQTESGGTTLRVRGVGTTGNNTGLESAVGIFLDGVYLSRPGIALGDLLDVNQVELLRGPQGTLFGRNTSAGALNIKTAKPNLNKLEVFGNATYGNYNLFNIQAGVSAPLVEGTLAARLSAAYRKQDGTVTSTTGAESNNRNRYIIRGQLLFEPSADLSIRLIGDYQNSDEKCCDAVILQETTLVAAGAFAAYGLPANGGAPVTGIGAQQSRISNGQEFRDRIDQWGVSGEVNLKLGDADLISITAYRNSRARSRQESDFVGLNVYSTSATGSTAVAGSLDSETRIKTFTQELRLSGSVFNDKFQYLVGGYYSDEQISERQNLTLGSDFQRYISANFFPFIAGNPAFGFNPLALGPVPAQTLAQGISAAGSFANNRFTQSGRNFSVFTNNTFKFSDTFGFNFGLRYSDDRKAGAFVQESASSPACLGVLSNPALAAGGPLNGFQALAVGFTCFPFAVQANILGPNTARLAPTPVPFNNVFKDNELIYTAKLTWEPIDKINTYVSYSHGYKAGGFNLDPTAAAGGADPRFASEKVDAYEIGIKTKLLDNALTANLALFHQDLSDFQVLEFTGVQFVTFNVDKAKATGGELELNARLSRELSFNGAYTYTNARYPVNCAPATANIAVRSLCGNKLTNAPEHVVIAGFNYDRDLGSNLTFGLNGSIRLESDRRTSTQAVIIAGNDVSTIRNPFDIQDGNAKLNLRAGIGSQNGAWRIEIWGNNITNVQTRNVTFNTPLRGGTFLPGALGANGAGISRGAFLQDPQTYGVTVRTKF